MELERTSNRLTALQGLSLARIGIAGCCELAAPRFAWFNASPVALFSVNPKRKKKLKTAASKEQHYSLESTTSFCCKSAPKDELNPRAVATYCCSAANCFRRGFHRCGSAFSCSCPNEHHCSGQPKLTEARPCGVMERRESRTYVAGSAGLVSGDPVDTAAQRSTRQVAGKPTERISSYHHP